MTYIGMNCEECGTPTMWRVRRVWDPAQRRFLFLECEGCRGRPGPFLIPMSELEQLVGLGGPSEADVRYLAEHYTVGSAEKVGRTWGTASRSGERHQAPSAR